MLTVNYLRVFACEHKEANRNESYRKTANDKRKLIQAYLHTNQLKYTSKDDK